MNWQRVVARIATEIEDRVDRVREEVERRTGRERPVRVVPYRGYGRPDVARVRGRVLRGAGPGPATPEDRWWVNLANTYRRIESDEVPGARLRVRFRGAEAEGTADLEGHFDIEVQPHDPPPGDRFWHEAVIELVDPPADSETATATVAIPDRPRFGVISDLDDTVLRTNATSLMRMAREVLFGNVHTRVAFPGVGAFYRALHQADDGHRNPLFYVSSSPWNLYDLLAEFLRLHDIPAGPMELRDWGLSRGELLPTGHGAHKRAAIDRILRTYPNTPFILVGDSGQEDPEIYRGVARDWPGHVLAAYIRNVHTAPARQAALERIGSEMDDVGVPMVLVDDTHAAATHAADRGFIDPATIDDIDRARDRERDDGAGPVDGPEAPVS